MKLWISVLAMALLVIASCNESGSDSVRPGDSPERAEAPDQDSDPASSSAWLSDPCSLVGDEEMSGLLPNPVAGQMVAPGLCEYGPVDLALGRVDVEVFAQDVAATGCELFFSVGGFNSAEPVDGIGTSARWKGASGPKQLGVCVNEEAALAITVYDPDQKTDPLAAARAVSELVIARLARR